MHRRQEVTYATDTVAGTTVRWYRLVVDGRITSHVIEAGGSRSNFSSHQQAQRVYNQLVRAAVTV